MSKQEVFKKVMVSDRLPKNRSYVPTINTLGGIDTLYHIADGEFTNSHVDTDTFNYIEAWLEKIELPSDDQILDYARDEQGLEDYDMEQDVFLKGANYILNKLK